MSVSASERHASQQPVIERYLEVGYNYRMTDIQAAVGRRQLALLEDFRRRWNPGRSEIPSIHSIDRLIAKLTAALL